MASVKIIIRKKQNSDGTFPLALRVTQNRISSYTYLGHSILEKNWDADKEKVKTGHPNSVRLNHFLTQKKSEALEKILEAQTEKKEVSAFAVKASIKGKNPESFFAQSELFLENLRLSGKFNQLVSEEPRLKHFREFLQSNGSLAKSGDIAFSDVTPNLLKTFRAWLEGTRRIKERTIINHFMAIRSVFSQAIKANPSLEKHYPFGKGKVSLRFPQSLKLGLTKEEVLKLEEVELPAGSPADHARNIWLISFYFAGIRVSDVLRLKWSDFQDERLHYSMGKNDKAGSIKISEKALKVLKRYLPIKDQTDLLFPELRSIPDLSDTFAVQRKTAFADKNLNKQLKKVAELAGINKNLSMHIARHTFGNISGDKIPIQMLQKLYRHSNITTTIGYQANFIHKESDEALDAVLGF